MSPMSQAAQNLNWLITNFVENTPGVSHTVVVSADGLLLAMSEGFPRDRADATRWPCWWTGRAPSSLRICVRNCRAACSTESNRQTGSAHRVVAP